MGGQFLAPTVGDDVRDAQRHFLDIRERRHEDERPPAFGHGSADDVRRVIVEGRVARPVFHERRRNVAVGQGEGHGAEVVHVGANRLVNAGQAVGADRPQEGFEIAGAHGERRADEQRLPARIGTAQHSSRVEGHHLEGVAAVGGDHSGAAIRDARVERDEGAEAARQVARVLRGQPPERGPNGRCVSDGFGRLLFEDDRVPVEGTGGPRLERLDGVGQARGRMAVLHRGQVERRDARFRKAGRDPGEGGGLVVDRDVRVDVAPHRVEDGHGVRLHHDGRGPGSLPLRVVGALVRTRRRQADVGMGHAKRAVVALEIVDQAGVFPCRGQLRAGFLVQVGAVRQNTGDASARNIVRPPQSARNGDGHDLRDAAHGLHHLVELLFGVGRDDDLGPATGRERRGHGIGERLAHARFRVDAPHLRVGGEEPLDALGEMILWRTGGRDDRPQQVHAVHEDASPFPSGSVFDRSRAFVRMGQSPLIRSSQFTRCSVPAARKSPSSTARRSAYSARKYPFSCGFVGADPPLPCEPVQGEERPGEFGLVRTPKAHPVIHLGAGRNGLPPAEQLLDVHLATRFLAQCLHFLFQPFLFVFPFLDTFIIWFLELLFCSDLPV